MPVKICMLTSVHQPFDGRIFHRECKTLVQAGYEVTLISPADFEREERDGIAVLGVPRPASRRGRPLVWWRLLRLVRGLQPDVIHFHDPELLLLVPLLRTLMGKPVKIVYDVHEYFADSVASKYWIPRGLRPFAASIAARLERALVRGVHGIVCAVEQQKQLYAGFQGPMVAVRNLPLARLFENAQPHPSLDVDGLKLIYVGLILPKRGIDVLLEAMRLLRQQGHQDIFLFLVGPETSPAYMERVRQFIQTNDLSVQVRLLGYVPHEELKHYLMAADIGMAPGLPTRQYRNPGIATKLFEYMLCTLPIISVDHPHRRKYIEESNCGLLVPGDDAAAHAQAILWLQNHPEQASAMGQRGRAMVLKSYAWEQEQEKLLAFYQDLGAPVR
jgi:glycosyltransferase involved in cell wall biosynthesis